MHLLDHESRGHGLRPAAFPKASSVPKILADGLPPPSMDHLDELEAQSIYILREAFARLKKLALLWSLGKDSNVMIWLARKAFFGRVPCPALHVDTGKKFPDISWRHIFYTHLPDQYRCILCIFFISKIELVKTS